MSQAPNQKTFGFTLRTLSRPRVKELLLSSSNSDSYCTAFLRLIKYFSQLPTTNATKRTSRASSQNIHLEPGADWDLKCGWMQCPYKVVPSSGTKWRVTSYSQLAWVLFILSSEKLKVRRFRNQRGPVWWLFRLELGTWGQHMTIRSHWMALCVLLGFLSSGNLANAQVAPTDNLNGSPNLPLWGGPRETGMGSVDFLHLLNKGCGGPNVLCLNPEYYDAPGGPFQTGDWKPHNICDSPVAHCIEGFTGTVILRDHLAPTDWAFEAFSKRACMNIMVTDAGGLPARCDYSELKLFKKIMDSVCGFFDCQGPRVNTKNCNMDGCPVPNRGNQSVDCQDSCDSAEQKKFEREEMMLDVEAHKREEEAKKQEEKEQEAKNERDRAEREQKAKDDEEHRIKLSDAQFGFEQSHTHTLIASDDLLISSVQTVEGILRSEGARMGRPSLDPEYEKQMVPYRSLFQPMPPIESLKQALEVFRAGENLHRSIKDGHTQYLKSNLAAFMAHRLDPFAAQATQDPLRLQVVWPVEVNGLRWKVAQAQMLSNYPWAKKHAINEAQARTKFVMQVETCQKDSQCVELIVGLTNKYIKPKFAK